jgi:membrane protein DedA with SNARE-associated domain
MASFLQHYGYWALIIFAFVEACCIPISSEITFAFAGLLANASSPHHLNLVLVIVIGTLAEMGGSLTSYAIGRRGGRTLIDRYGKWVLVSHSDVDRAERFFAGKGTWIVAVARVLPLVRCFASFGAGVVEIPAAPFAIFSLIGTAAWATALSLLGYNLYSTVHKFFHSFSLAGIVLVVVLIIGLVVHRLHAMRKDAHRQAAAGAVAGAEATGIDQPAEPQAKVGTGRVGGAHRSGRTPSP